MNEAIIRIVTRGRKKGQPRRCSPPCMLFNGTNCVAQLDAKPGICGDRCPLDGAYALHRIAKGDKGNAGVRSNIGKD